MTTGWKKDTGIPMFQQQTTFCMYKKGVLQYKRLTVISNESVI